MHAYVRGQTMAEAGGRGGLEGGGVAGRGLGTRPPPKQPHLPAHAWRGRWGRWVHMAGSVGEMGTQGQPRPLHACTNTLMQLPAAGRSPARPSAAQHGLVALACSASSSSPSTLSVDPSYSGGAHAHMLMQRFPQTHVHDGAMPSTAQHAQHGPSTAPPWLAAPPARRPAPSAWSRRTRCAPRSGAAPRRPTP